MLQGKEDLFMFVVSWLQQEPLLGTVSLVSCRLRTHLRSRKIDRVKHGMILITRLSPQHQSRKLNAHGYCSFTNLARTLDN